MISTVWGFHLPGDRSCLNLCRAERVDMPVRFRIDNRSTDLNFTFSET
jgi:hypothetical protein